MSDDASADYALWVRMANDPSQSEQTRLYYRARMETYLHAKMREAFVLAARARPAASEDPSA
jgi:hypothetical protein